MPALSVVMSVFNGSDFLNESIQSILSQTFEDFEFIIVNDGSVDNSKEIIDAFARRDTRIKVIEQANMGLPASLNRAIGEANSNLIARMDSDDISLSNRFERQLEVIKNSRYDLVGTGIFKIDQFGSVERKCFFPEKHEEIAHELPMRNCISHPSVIFSRKIFGEAGGYDVRYKNSQDYDLWLRMLGKGLMCNIKEPLLKYRRHSNRISSVSNRIRQTNYSVCAALNFFNRGANLPILMPNFSPGEIINNIELLLSRINDKYSRDCILRHATRYFRYCLTDENQRITLKRLVFETANISQRLKFMVYESLG